MARREINRNARIKLNNGLPQCHPERKPAGVSPVTCSGLVLRLPSAMGRARVACAMRHGCVERWQHLASARPHDLSSAIGALVRSNWSWKTDQNTYHRKLGQGNRHFLFRLSASWADLIVRFTRGQYLELGNVRSDSNDLFGAGASYLFSGMRNPGEQCNFPYARASPRNTTKIVRSASTDVT
jgi:hypothetical protein